MRLQVKYRFGEMTNEILKKAGAKVVFESIPGTSRRSQKIAVFLGTLDDIVA